MSLKVYVAGIPSSMSVDDIKSELSSQTTGVKGVQVTTGDDGAHTGIAFVTYASEADAQAAVDGRVVLGKSQLTLTRYAETGAKRGRAAAEGAGGPPAKRAKKEEESRVLVVSNFPADTSKAALEQLFAVHGDVQQVEIHAAPGKRPFAVVHMQEKYQAVRAKREIDDNLWRGHSLKVDYSFEDVAENPTETSRVTIALDPDVPGNDRLPLGGLLEWVAWAMANDWDQPIVVDASGNIIIPNARAGDDEDEEEAEEEAVQA